MPVYVSDDALRIDCFATRERSIVDYFSKMPDSDIEEKLETLLKLGIMIQSSVSTVTDTKYVEAAFDHLKDKFDRKMDAIFEPNGAVSTMLAEYFGQDGRIVKDIFNLDAEGTPLYRLKAELHNDLTDIQNMMAKKEGQDIEAKKGTQKGMKFEDFCQPFLEDMARMYSDTAERTSDTKTQGGESKKGDFVVTLDGIEKKIVFEMKHREKFNLPEIKRELNKAMENRNANYAVLVSRNRNMLGREVGWFNEYDMNKLVCALSETDDDDENLWVIDMAYRWARQRVVSDSDKRLGIDPKLVKQNIKDIEASMNRMVEITKQCRNITTATEAIDNKIKEEVQIIRDKINHIIHSMNNTRQS